MAECKTCEGKGRTKPVRMSAGAEMHLGGRVIRFAEDCFVALDCPDCGGTGEAPAREVGNADPT